MKADPEGAPKWQWLRQQPLRLLLAALAALFVVLPVGLFHELVDWQHWLLLGRYDNFTDVDPLIRLALPFLALPPLLLLGRLLRLQQQRLGIPLVIERIHRGDGTLPWRNTLHQFIGGYLALSFGFSVGREGPIVHLGAAASAHLGRWLKQPTATLQLLSASGACAAIALVFATPLAAIAFVMEVLLRRWQLSWLPPLLLAAAIAYRAHGWLPVGNAELALWMGSTALPDSAAWPLLVLIGGLIGLIGALFNHLLVSLLKQTQVESSGKRFFLAAMITALLGTMLPYTMGTLGGVHGLFMESPSLGLLLLVLLAKLLMTTTALGLGIPGGVVGPIYGIGLLLGLSFAALATLAGLPLPAETLALLGLAAFSAAVLQAPLTALLTVMELSQQWSLLPATLTTLLPAWLVQRWLCQGQCACRYCWHRPHAG